MTYDRDDFQRLSEKKQHDAVVREIGTLRQIQTAAPDMQVLTNSDEWNRYLSYLQEQLARIKAAREAAAVRQLSPMLWDAAQLTKVKSELLVSDAIIETFYFCMRLPKAILDDNEQVSKIIKQFEEKNASTTP